MFLDLSPCLAAEFMMPMGGGGLKDLTLPAGKDTYDG
jgi:hypothetical protein